MEKKLYKNWSEICKLGDHLLIILLATLDMASEYADRLVFAFPECFSEKQQSGPYPMSYIRKLALKKGGGKNSADFPQSYDIDSQLKMPCVLLAYDEESLAEYPDLLELRPDNISMNVSQGDVVEYEGRKMVVLENNESCREIALVPAELVDVNI